MTLIGEIYRDGFAVKQDFAESERWFRLASGLGYAGAEFEHGVMLLDGAPGVHARPRRPRRPNSRRRRRRIIPPRSTISACSPRRPTPPAKPDFAKAAARFQTRRRTRRRQRRLFLWRAAQGGQRRRRSTRRRPRAGLRSAADAGIIAGQVEYAIMLFNGVGVERDESRRGEDLHQGRDAPQSDRDEPPRAPLYRRPRRAAGPRPGRRLAPPRQSRRPRRRQLSTRRPEA